MTDRFRDREEAGRRLAGKLRPYVGAARTAVYALARGGVEVGAAVAAELGIPLDVIAVRKIGSPSNPELAVGAVAAGGNPIVNEELRRACGVTAHEFARSAAAKLAEANERDEMYHRSARRIDPEGRVCIVVDDGLATGATMKAAVAWLASKGPARIVVAAPVGSASACEEVSNKARTECVCGLVPEPMYAVGMWFDEFGQVSDERVAMLLARRAASDNVKSEGGGT